jgi:hypothetical protein
MKSLILPLSLLLMTAASCTKRDLPSPISLESGPVIDNGTGSGPGSGTGHHSGPAAQRRAGDTLVIINLLPTEKGPMPNGKDPIIRP